jgi:lysophospholipase L1-like esterase
MQVNAGLLKLPKHHPRTFICDLAAQTQFSYPNKYSPFWSSDGLHLSATGYDVLGKLLFNTMLESKLNEKSSTSN